MSYINNYGQSIGPIKIENTWVGTRNENKFYLSFAKDSATLQGSKDAFVPLMAATPDSNAPSNAVATIEWVKWYTVAGSGDPIDFSKYATRSELNAATLEIEQLRYDVNLLSDNIADYTTDINNLNTAIVRLTDLVETNRKNILSNDEDILKLDKDILSLYNGLEETNKRVDVNANNILLNSNRIENNSYNIALNRSEIEAIKALVEEGGIDIEEAVTKVVELEQDVKDLQDTTALQQNLIDSNIFSINEINQTLQEYNEWFDNPFADGLIIVCGGARLNAS